MRRRRKQQHGWLLTHWQGVPEGCRHLVLLLRLMMLLPAGEVPLQAWLGLEVPPLWTACSSNHHGNLLVLCRGNHKPQTSV